MKSIVAQQQQPLIDHYRTDPTAAWITDLAVVEGKNLNDPFHTSVSINDELQTPFPIGLHRGLGGYHDFPNPGDLLCAALASCFENTLRLVANRLGINLKSTQVTASAEVDLRGTLMVSREVPVGFQRMSLDVHLTAGPVAEEVIRKLIPTAERCCVIYQTLSRGYPSTLLLRYRLPKRPQLPDLR